jgi:hypothetical protein
VSDATEALRSIEAYVELARARRARALDAQSKAKMEALDEALRDLIQGARPAPRRIANPNAVGSTTPAHGVAPAKIQVKASQALEQALELSREDKKKLGEVKLESLPKSSYTPPRVPAFMADYYSDTLVPAKISTTDLPSQAVSPSGESMDLALEVRILLGLEHPNKLEHPSKPTQAEPGRRGVEPPSRPAAGPAARAPNDPEGAGGGAARRPASGPAAAPAAPQPETRGVPVIVHLMAGGTQRGRLERFDPKTGRLELLGRSGEAEPMPLDQVLAVFFGARVGGGSTDATGAALLVKLVNDRQVSGLSPDYNAGGDALTLVPEPRRGNIDHIWVPAWAVKSIELL